jgi:hypothetical protein
MDQLSNIRLLTRAAPFAVAAAMRAVSFEKIYAMPGFFHSFKESEESPRKLSFSCVIGCAPSA